MAEGGGSDGRGTPADPDARADSGTPADTDPGTPVDAGTPTPADPGPPDAPADPDAAPGRGPGVREALLVGAGVVLSVLAAAAVTFVLPPEVRDVVFRTPLLIGFLIGGTGVVLWRITRPPRPDR